MPIRWLSYETLKDRWYSSKSDVWAYGVLCWEVIEEGAEPYAGWSNAKVREMIINEDYRMTISPVIRE